MLIEEFTELQKLDAAIDNTLTSLLGMKPESEEFAKLAKQLTELTKAKEIIANLKLKAFEAKSKKANDENNIRIKEEEVIQRRTENATREADSNQAHQLRESELEMRRNDLVVSQTLKAQELELRREEADDRRKVSKETLAVIAANLTGIVIILGYERANVIASKALGFIGKLR